MEVAWYVDIPDNARNKAACYAKVPELNVRKTSVTYY